MTVYRILMLAFAALLSGAAMSAQAQDASPSFVVSYIHVAPSARAAAVTLLRKMRGISRAQAGSVDFQILRNVDRPQQFVVVETWKDAKAQESHAAAADTKELMGKLTPLLVAPYDERPHLGFAMGPPAGPVRHGLYVVTHVDFNSAKKDLGLAAVKQLAAHSVKDAGVLRFDVLQQANRLNHVTLIEIWRDASALEKHEGAAHTRKFRDDLLPISGSPYDQRLYRAID